MRRYDGSKYKKTVVSMCMYNIYKYYNHIDHRGFPVQWLFLRPLIAALPLTRFSARYAPVPAPIFQEENQAKIY